MPRVLIPVGTGIAPDVPVAVRVLPRCTGRDEPGMLARGVGGHEVDDHAQTLLVGAAKQRVEVCEGPEEGIDVAEVGHVVATVAKRRVIERQDPKAVDAKPLQVVKAVRQPDKVPCAVTIGVAECVDRDFVEDGGLEPTGLGHGLAPDQDAVSTMTVVSLGGGGCSIRSE